MLQNFLLYLCANWLEVVRLTALHVAIVGVSVAVAFAFALPAGILVTRKRYRRHAVTMLALANVFQTIPSLAVIGLASALLAFIRLGIGWWPAILALILYSILPILSNTIVGLNQIDRAILRAAYGMGMSDGQVLRKIELPLAFPVIVAGLRTALVINIGTAALAAAIGADCLGTLIFQGISTGNISLLLAGAVPTGLLAILLDFLLGKVEAKLVPSRIKG